MNIVQLLLVPVCAVMGTISATILTWGVWRCWVLSSFRFGWLNPDHYGRAAPGFDVFYIVVQTIAAFGFVFCGSLAAPAHHRSLTKWLLFTVVALGFLWLFGRDVIMYYPFIVGGSFAVLLCGGKRRSNLRR